MTYVNQSLFITRGFFQFRFEFKILEQNFKVKVIKFLAEDFKTYPSQSYLNKQLPGKKNTMHLRKFTFYINFELKTF